MTYLLAALLASGLLVASLPRVIAHLSLLPGLPATDLILAGEHVTPEGFGRAVQAHRAALAWLDSGRWHTRLGMVLTMHARHLEENAAEQALMQGLEEILLGLQREPADGHGWLILARGFLQAERWLEAALCLEWSVRTLRYDPDNAAVRVPMAFELWDLLNPATQEAVRHELIAWFRRAPSDVVAFAILSGTEGRVAAMLAYDPAAAERFARLRGELERKALSSHQKGNGS